MSLERDQLTKESTKRCECSPLAMTGFNLNALDALISALSYLGINTLIKHPLTLFSEKQFTTN